MLVLKNMDELMDTAIPDNGLAACHACVCNPRKLSHYPPSWSFFLPSSQLISRVPQACAYTYQLYPASIKEGMPVLFPQGLGELNGGLQIFKPSREKYERIFHVLNTSEPGEFLFADQSLLSKTFRGEWTPLYQRYLPSALMSDRISTMLSKRCGRRIRKFGRTRKSRMCITFWQSHGMTNSGKKVWRIPIYGGGK